MTIASEENTTKILNELGSNSLNGELFQMTVSLLLVLAIIFILAYLLKKISFIQSGKIENLYIVGGLSLGGKEKIMIVQVGKKQLLLGVTPEKISTLYVLEEELQINKEKKGSFLKIMQRNQHE